ncbi:hypothetical protein [Flavobacterium sp. SM2513]|uniref:hypothetical protein n=1 Tax=Flavobacterium sp. SM2513 TaxID=3424766 RepID=UPI003D7F7A8A
MTKIYQLLIILSTAFLFSCEKQEPECFLTAPNLYVNGELYTETPTTVEILDNENITLGTKLDDSFDCLWTGPNGFESNERSVVLSNATNADSGTYTLVCSKGICTVTTSLELNVLATIIPCTPEKNRLKFTHEGVSTLNFYGSLNSANTGYYTMRMNGSAGSLTLMFSNENPPESGVYVINPENPTSPGTGELSVAISYQGSYGEAREGNVYITKLASGDYKITFCDLRFYTGYPVILIGSTLINQDEL